MPLFDYNDEVLDAPGEAAFEEKPDGSALVPPRVVFQPASPYRASDHDPVIVGLFAVADLGVTVTPPSATVVALGSAPFTAIVTNNGPDTAVTISVGLSLTGDTGTRHQACPAPVCWLATTGRLPACSGARVRRWHWTCSPAAVP